MANIAALNTVYNHFMTTYAPQGTNTKYDTHKKSELRGVYNSIVKLNKDAPLFLLDQSASAKEFAVGIKEGSRELKNVISSLSTEDSSDLLNKKSAESSDSSLVSAEFVGDTVDEEVPSLEIEVKELAKGQSNVGNFVKKDALGLNPGTYSFDIHVRDADYEFQFNIEAGDTNQKIEEKLARLISKANIGVSASTVSDEEGNIALQLTSDDVGIREDSEFQFQVTDDKTSKSRGVVEYFGLNQIEQMPSNSSLVINGEEATTKSNHFTVGGLYELTLHNETPEGTSVNIGLKTDVESLSENINYLIKGYNDFLDKAAKYLDKQPYSGKLIKEMNGLSSIYKGDLESVGINVEENGHISLDKNLLSQTAQEEDALERFSSIKSFTGAVLNKINQVSLNPMEYTQRTVVAYKNPGKTYPSPYVTSNYSGMMFSSYC